MLTEQRIKELWSSAAQDLPRLAATGQRVAIFARAVEAEATAELRADNDRLRALLREARVDVVTSMESCAERGLDKSAWEAADLLKRIDAAIAAKGE